MEWLKVEGWPYLVNEFGDVKHELTGRIRKQVLHHSGYMNVQLWDKGRFSSKLTHRLVAIAFYGDKTKEGLEVCHNDGDKLNNHKKNLRWDTHTSNMVDRDLHGKTPIEEKSKCLKHNKDLVLKSIDLHKSGISLKKIEKILNIPSATVFSYVNGSRRKTITRKKYD